MTDFYDLYNKVTTADRGIQALRDMRDDWANDIEAAAHRLIKSRNKYSRLGQYPSLRDTGGEFNEHLVSFDVTNGIDYGDDFSIAFTLKELGQA